jgi:hypothetical protein
LQGLKVLIVDGNSLEVYDFLNVQEDVMNVKVCCKCGEEIFPGQEFKGSGKRKRHFKPECGLAKARVADELLPVWGKDNDFFYPQLSERVLGSRLAVARQYCYCYFCEHDVVDYESDDDNHDRSLIFPGEQCIREVWLVPVGEYWERRRTLEVRFFHHPHCPLPFDDPDKRKKYCDIFEMERKPITKPAGFSVTRRAA